MPMVFIFHGIQGHPKENWFPWLQQELESRGYSVIIPAFPHPDAPLLEEWLSEMSPYEKQIDKETIFIGHSLGSAFALRYLERLPKAIDRLILVAPVWCVMGNQFDSLIATFTEAPYDFEKIQRNTNQRKIYQSDNDPYIKTSLSEELANKLDAKLIMIPQAGHFNTASGYMKFPQLLEAVR